MANAVHVHSEKKYKFVCWADIVFRYVFQINCKLNPFYHIFLVSSISRGFQLAILQLFRHFYKVVVVLTGRALKKSALPWEHNFL